MQRAAAVPVDDHFANRRDLAPIDGGRMTGINRMSRLAPHPANPAHPVPTSSWLSETCPPARRHSCSLFSVPPCPPWSILTFTDAGKVLTADELTRKTLPRLVEFGAAGYDEVDT